jgi:hypothetical protein
MAGEHVHAAGRSVGGADGVHARVGGLLGVSGNQRGHSSNDRNRAGGPHHGANPPAVRAHRPARGWAGEGVCQEAIATVRARLGRGGWPCTAVGAARPPGDDWLHGKPSVVAERPRNHRVEDARSGVASSAFRSRRDSPPSTVPPPSRADRQPAPSPLDRPATWPSRDRWPPPSPLAPAAPSSACRFDHPFLGGRLRASEQCLRSRRADPAPARLRGRESFASALLVGRVRRACLRSLALAVDDADASAGTFTHWLGWARDPGPRASPRARRHRPRGARTSARAATEGPDHRPATAATDTPYASTPSTPNPSCAETPAGEKSSAR